MAGARRAGLHGRRGFVPNRVHRGEARSALDGATTAVYLVRSMLPSTRLVQATFSDLDPPAPRRVLMIQSD